MLAILRTRITRRSVELIFAASLKKAAGTRPLHASLPLNPERFNLIYD